MSDDITPLDYLRAIRDSRDLSPAEKLVALVMMSHAGQDGKDAHPGIKRLSEETGYGRDTVMKCLRSLREKSWLLQVFSGRGGAHDRASEFKLSVPKSTQTTLAGSPKVDLTPSQSRSDTVPKSTQSTTDALRDAPIDACSARGRRRVRRAGQDKSSSPNKYLCPQCGLKPPSWHPDEREIWEKNHAAHS